ncbi:fimbrial protein [Providencia hangzhouensis]
MIPPDNDILAINQAVGVANNLGVALFEKDAITQIKLFEDSKQIEFDGTTVSLDYVARYKATGVVTSGPANSSAVYSIQYH